MSWLRKISFFKNFDDKSIEMIEKNSTIVTYDSGDILFYEQDEPKFLFLLLSGRVDIYKTSSKGKQFYINTIKKIDFIGEIAVFYNTVYPATAECNSKCKILRIDYYKIDKKILEDLFFCKELVNSLYDRISVLMDVIGSNFLTTKERVARFIINNSKDFNNTTYTNISKQLNMTPETLSRILNNFKRNSYIDIDSTHNIKIIDKNKLIKIIR